MRDDDKGEREERAPVLVVPHDPVTEQTLVAAAAVLDAAGRAELLDRVPAEAFQVQEHRALWAGFAELRRRSLAFDPSTLQRIVGDRAKVEYLSKLLALRPEPPEDLSFHVDAILWDAARARGAAGPVSALLEALKSPAEAPDRVRALARAVAQAFAGAHGSGRNLLDPGELARSQAAEVRRRADGQAVYPFGIRGLDYYEAGAKDSNGRDVGGTRRIIPGAAPGMVTLLAGSSGSGKSTTAAHLALGLARQRRRGLYCAWEPSGGMTLELMACLSLGWSRTALIQGKDQRDLAEPMPNDQHVQLEERMHEIGKWIRFMSNPFYRGERSLPNARRRVNDDNLDVLQEHVAVAGVEWVVCDLWERLLVDTRPDDEKRALFRQQAMAADTRTHYVLLAQHRKDTESRPDKRPTREGVAGSGAWVQVADNLLAPHRPGLWKPGVGDTTLEIHVLKQRWGRWPLSVEFDWDADKGSIAGGRSLAYEHPGEASGFGPDVESTMAPAFGGGRRKRGGG